ncbi:hypothetical protein M758_7G107200 [Ceratodon purpureus]|nr:hypothetical protein M758_7G107200 [Ceratodon purpureus]
MAQACAPRSTPPSLHTIPSHLPSSTSHNCTPTLTNGPHSILTSSLSPSQTWREPQSSSRREVYTSGHIWGERIRREVSSSGQTWGGVQSSRQMWGKKTVRGRVVCAAGDRIEDLLPTQEDIVAAAREKGMLLAIKVTGPLFVVTAIDVATGENLGTADGFIKPWIDANILHLDSIRLTKASASRTGRTIFGAAVYMGALMVRHGIDSACNKGELLAINDSDVYHKKLVRYYGRLGWKPVHEVKGESLQDFFHMLVWGGVGTRMDADLRELLGKWASTMKSSRGKAMVGS